MRRFFIFFPLLVLYMLCVALLSKDRFQGDEARYVSCSRNLLHGTYAYKDEIRLDLLNGPGYPIVLLPMTALHLPLLAGKMFNAILFFGAVLYLFCAVKLFTSTRIAMIVAFFFGIYPPNLKYLPLLLTETAATFFCTGFAYYFLCALIREKNDWRVIGGGIFFGTMLALTKVIFGYILLGTVIVFGFAALLKLPGFKRGLIICVLALVGTTPYLFYTYSLTGKIFYWSVLGSESLYFLTSPFPGEFGDFQWHDVDRSEQLVINHAALYNQIDTMPVLSRDEKLKRKAIENILRHPGKVIANYCANIGRMSFNYPYSYKLQSMSAYGYIIPNMFLIVLFAFSFVSFCLRHYLLSKSVLPLFVFGAIAAGCISSVSCMHRMSMVLVPLQILWIVYVFSGTMTISLKKGKREQYVATSADRQDA